MPNTDPSKSEKKPPTQAEELDTWLRGHDEDPERYTQLPDGSVQIRILYPYRVEDEGDENHPGPKVVKLRTMYAGDWRELGNASETGVISTHETVLRLGDIEAHNLLRMTWVDYSALLTAAQGVLEKKFRPTS